MKTGKRAVAFGLLAAGLLAAAAPAEGAGNRIEAIRFWSLADLTRVAIQTQADAEFRADRAEDPPRIFFDLEGFLRRPGRRGIETIEVDDALLSRIRVAETKPGTMRIVLDLKVRAEYSVSQLANPPRIVVELRPEGGVAAAAARAQSMLDLPAQAGKPGAPAAAKAGQPAAQTPKPEPPLELPVVGRSVLSEATAARQARPPKTGSAAGGPGEPPAATPKPEPPLELPVVGRSVLSEAASARQAQPPKIAGAPPASAGTARAGGPGESAAAKAGQPAAQTPKPEAGGDTERTAQAAKPLPALPAKSDSRGDRSLIRALGLKLERIVLDPGHGGHDTGTIGRGGLQEKNLVLDIAKRLGELIGQRLGSEVIYTRTDDTFIPLEERTAIANERKADLFLSIHANSSRSRAVAGSETFYLNFTTSADELEVAARENATSQTPIHELQDLLQNIMKSEKSQESREFAASVQKALYSGLSRGRWKNRGVKKAPFIVLVKANMPSVLAEVAFLSNAREERELKLPANRQRVAEALYRGVAQYASTLSHFRTTQETTAKPAAGQGDTAR